MQDQMSKENIEQRIKLLKAMNTIILNLNNENAYMIWIENAIPDNASEEDYQFVAEFIDIPDGETTSLYEDTCRLFTNLITRYAINGYYTGNVLSETRTKKEYLQMLTNKYFDIKEEEWEEI